MLVADWLLFEFIEVKGKLLIAQSRKDKKEEGLKAFFLSQRTSRKSLKLKRFVAKVCWISSLLSLFEVLLFIGIMTTSTSPQILLSSKDSLMKTGSKTCSPWWIWWGKCMRMEGRASYLDSIWIPWRKISSCFLVNCRKWRANFILQIWTWKGCMS